MVRPNSVIFPPPQLIMDSGRRCVVSSAAESVITLNTEPGSNGAAMARFFARCNILPGFGGSFGS